MGCRSPWLVVFATLHYYALFWLLLGWCNKLPHYGLVEAVAWFVLLLVLLGEESGKSSAGGSCMAAVVRVCWLKAVLSWAWGLAPHVAGGLLAVLWELSWVVNWSISTWPLYPGELRSVRRLTGELLSPRAGLLGEPGRTCVLSSTWPWSWPPRYSAGQSSRRSPQTQWEKTYFISQWEEWEGICGH